MLRALGFEVNPEPVFASFMLSTLAQTLGVAPGGLGVFEAVSVATLKLIGVPVTVGLEATLLFRFFTFWLPMAPGLVLARREARARWACPCLRCREDARPYATQEYVTGLIRMHKTNC
jgi:uncharacterized protein (TIRG00374 family)